MKKKLKIIGNVTELLCTRPSLKIFIEKDIRYHPSYRLFKRDYFIFFKIIPIHIVNNNNKK